MTLQSNGTDHNNYDIIIVIIIIIKGEFWAWRFKLNCQIAIGDWAVLARLVMAVRIELPNWQWRFGGFLPFDNGQNSKS